MTNEKKEIFDITISPITKRFYSDKNNYGIFVTKIELDSKDYEVVSSQGMEDSLMLVGTMPELEIGKVYDARVERKEHPKFGLQYETQLIYEKMFSSREQQVTFLETILTENQLMAISDAYPTGNLIEMFKNDEIDHNLLYGIGEKTLEKIKNRIEENEKYKNALIELTGAFQIPYNVVIRLSNKYGSPDLLLKKIKENPYLLTEVDGFGFIEVDKIALSMGVEKNSKMRIMSCISYLLIQESGNGHIWLKTNSVISKATKLLGLRIAEIQKVLNEELKLSDEIKEVDKKLFLNYNFESELGLYTHLTRLLSFKPTLAMDFDIDKEIAEVEKEQGFEFTDEQRKAIEYGIKYNVLIVVGKAGAGKTAVIKGIVKVLTKHQESLVAENPEDNQPLAYATCALSGKASQRIRESTGLDSFTIHRLLKFNPHEGFLYDEHNKLPHDVIVLDEGSMVNSQLAYQLIRAIDNGGKLIITGDIAQLEPIGAGNFLVDLLNNPIIPYVELTKVHRQAQASGILYNANLVRDGIRFVKENDKAQRMGELKDLYYRPCKDKETIMKKVLDISRKYKGDILDFQILAPMKTRGDLSTQNLNKELQLIFNQDPEDVEDHKKIKKKSGILLEGDKVIINGNNYDKNIFNGTMGIVEHIDKKGEGEIIIDFEDVGRITLKNNDMNQIELAYAISVHKSQGSQWKFVVFAFDYSSYVLLNRQSLYTGKTRAEKALFLIVEVKALFHAIDTDKSSKRNTFLGDMLNGEEYIMDYVKELIIEREKKKKKDEELELEEALTI